MSAAGAAAAGAPPRPAGDRLAAIVFALLVAACFAAFLLTQRLKHTPTALQRFELTPRFIPGSRGPLALEAISFKTARADRATVAIISAETGEVVTTLVHEYPVARYKQLSLRWNGRTRAPRAPRLTRTATGRVIVLVASTGRLAPPGEYRVRVTLARSGTTVLSPREFTLLGR